jgi:hypothetical protein
MLDVRAENHNGSLQSNDGLSVPRVTTIPVDGLQQGQLIFLTQDDAVNNYTKGFHFWQDGSWNPIGAASLNTTGGSQVFTGAWYIGNPTSSNTSFSEIKGNITDITVNTSLSHENGITYNVTLDNNYLTGTLGTDFQIVSVLETRNPNNTRFNDAHTHRVVQKLTDNSFQITLWNFENSSARQIGIAIAIVRQTDLPALSSLPSNLGIHNTLADLNTTYTSPYTSDVATLSTFDATLNHIDGTTTVPAGQASYSVYYNGTDWVYTGWQTTNVTATSWIVDPEGPIFKGTITDPTKADIREFDRIRFRELPNNWVEVELRYAANSRSGAADGAGDYLFKLPNNYQFNPNEHTFYTGSDVQSNSVIETLTLPVDQSIFSQLSQSGSEVKLIPYNSQYFRALTYSGSIDDSYVRDGHYSMRFSHKVIYLRYRFKRL